MNNEEEVKLTSMEKISRIGIFLVILFLFFAFWGYLSDQHNEDLIEQELKFEDRLSEKDQCIDDLKETIDNARDEIDELNNFTRDKDYDTFDELHERLEDTANQLSQISDKTLSDSIYCD